MKTIPINTTSDGCAFAIVTRYEARAYIKSMTGGGGYYPCTGVLEVSDEHDRRTLQDDLRTDGQAVVGELPRKA